jgi:hypothetical protein
MNYDFMTLTGIKPDIFKKQFELLDYVLDSINGGYTLAQKVVCLGAGLPSVYV